VGGDVSATGVKGLTSRWEADAEGMRSALAATTRVALGDRDAVGFLLKRTGDGICMAFNSPEYVVDAGVALK
jgi:hypothetical protein